MEIIREEPEPEDPGLKEPSLMEQMAEACRYENPSDEEVEEDDNRNPNDNSNEETETSK